MNKTKYKKVVEWKGPADFGLITCLLSASLAFSFLLGMAAEDFPYFVWPMVFIFGAVGGYFLFTAMLEVERKVWWVKK